MDVVGYILFYKIRKTGIIHLSTLDCDKNMYHTSNANQLMQVLQKYSKYSEVQGSKV